MAWSAARSEARSNGFVFGIVYDLALTTPFGLWPLVLCVAGFVVGLTRNEAIRDNRWLQMGIVFVASGAVMVTYAAVATVFGSEAILTLRLIPTALVVAVVNAALTRPAVKVMRFTLLAGDRRPCSQGGKEPSPLRSPHRLVPPSAALRLLGGGAACGPSAGATPPHPHARTPRQRGASRNRHVTAAEAFRHGRMEDLWRGTDEGCASVCSGSWPCPSSRPSSPACGTCR